MATIRITNPFVHFTEVDGSPLDYGQIYIGDENMDAEANPKAIFWDEALTVPASQPLTTVAGYIYNGTAPGTVYTNGAYSITIRDARDELVVSADSSTTYNHEDDTVAHGATGAVVGTTNSQTLTNKTLTAPVIADFTNAAHTHTGASSGGAITVDKAKVSANDTTAGYLNGKLVAGTNVTFTEGSDGGNETLTIASASTIPGTFASAANATGHTITNTEEVIELLDLGTVTSGEVYIITGQVAATKGGTAGMVAAQIKKSSGTAVIKFATEGGNDQTIVDNRCYAAISQVWSATPFGIATVTTSGTLVVGIAARSDGSDSTASTATVITSLTAIRIK